MNKRLLYCILLFPGLAFMGCKKENRGAAPAPVNAKKYYPVKFTVNGITAARPGAALRTASGGNSRAAEPISGNFGMLSVALFNPNYFPGADIQQFTQDSTVAYFGTITDSLPAGTYTAAIAAGHSLLRFQPNYYFYFGSQDGGIQDFLENQFTFTVGNSPVTQNVTLTRQIGELQIKITDNIPANASSFAVSIANDYNEFSIASNATVGPGYTRSFTNTIPAAAVGTSGYQINTLVGNVVAPFSVNIVCYDASNNQIVSATINNVSCKANTVTILSGNLFSSGNSFTVGADGAWSQTPSKIVNF